MISTPAMKRTLYIFSMSHITVLTPNAEVEQVRMTSIQNTYSGIYSLASHFLISNIRCYIYETVTYMINGTLFVFHREIIQSIYRTKNHISSPMLEKSLPSGKEHFERHLEKKSIRTLLSHQNWVFL